MEKQQRSVRNTVFTVFMLLILLCVFFLAGLLGFAKLRSYFKTDDQRMHEWVLPYDQITSIQYIRFTDKDGNVSICSPSGEEKTELYELVCEVTGWECRETALENPWRFDFVTEAGTFSLEADESDRILLDNTGYSLTNPYGKELADFCIRHSFSDAPTLTLNCEYISDGLEPVILASNWSLQSSPTASPEIPTAITDPSALPLLDDSVYVVLDFSLIPDRYSIWLWPLGNAGNPEGNVIPFADFTDEICFPLPETGDYLVELCGQWNLPDQTGGTVCYAFRYSAPQTSAAG
ncbi:MAG: hypothetical protein PUC06_11420 [Oscillospiraceae bacterium]|nr:hypothetical protein [Oscillospiraceae bacterium]